MPNLAGTWLNLESRRGQVEQIRENSSRPGRAFRHYRTTGAGHLIEPVVFEFGVSFVELPNFTFGASVDEAVELPETPPTYCAGVYKWRKNGDDFYTGAWCWFVVEGFDDDSFALIFSLSFEGVASKDILNSPGFPVNELDA